MAEPCPHADTLPGCRTVCDTCQLDARRRRKRTPKYRARERERMNAPAAKARKRELRNTPEAKERDRAYKRTPEYKQRERERRNTAEFKSRESERKRTPEYKLGRRRSRGIVDAHLVDHLTYIQDGRCAICDTTTPRGRGTWHADHDHKTGLVRGLLCNACNVGLGFLKDDPVLLRKAAEYLECPPAADVRRVLGVKT